MGACKIFNQLIFVLYLFTYCGNTCVNYSVYSASDTKKKQNYLLTYSVNKINIFLEQI